MPAENEGAAPAAPDTRALGVPVVVLVDLAEYEKWLDTLYGGGPDDPPPADLVESVREIIGEGVRAMRDELSHVDGLNVVYEETDAPDGIDDAPDGL